MNNIKTQIWLKEKARLIGLAYRILGSWCDAEDIVQDTYLKWQNSTAKPQNPQAYLTTICTRLAIDFLRSSHQKRLEYVGDWLPEFIPSETLDPIDLHERQQTISTAFMLLLEQLNPKERAAYVLREVFDEEYESIAKTLRTNATTIRKTVSRARKKIDNSKTASPPFEPTNHEHVLNVFQEAVQSGDTSKLAPLLNENISLVTDSGGNVRALRRPLHGIDEVLPFIGERLNHFWQNAQWQFTSFNGQTGLVLRIDDTIFAAATFCFNSQIEIHQIHIMRNPEKLNLLGSSKIPK